MIEVVFEYNNQIVKASCEDVDMANIYEFKLEVYDTTGEIITNSLDLQTMETIQELTHDRLYFQKHYIDLNYF